MLLRGSRKASRGSGMPTKGSGNRATCPQHWPVGPENGPCRLFDDDTLAMPGLKPGERLRARVACLNGTSTMDNLAFAEGKSRYVE